MDLMTLETLKQNRERICSLDISTLNKMHKDDVDRAFNMVCQIDILLSNVEELEYQTNKFIGQLRTLGVEI